MVKLLLGNGFNHLFALLQILCNVPVLICHVSDETALISEVRVDSAHDLGSLVTLLFDVNQLVVHVVQLASAIKKFIAHVSIELFLGLWDTTK